VKYVKGDKTGMNKKGTKHKSRKISGVRSAERSEKLEGTKWNIPPPLLLILSLPLLVLNYPDTDTLMGVNSLY